MMKTLHKVLGITLVELMVALVISSVLLLGVVTLYGNSKRTHIVGEEFAGLQENGRMAMKFMVEDIRMAGFMGCAWNNGEDAKFQCYLDSTSDSNFVCDNIAVGLNGYDANDPDTGTPEIDITTSTSGDPNSPLQTGARTAWSKSGATQLPNSFPITTAPVVGSDIIIVRHGDDAGIQIASNKESANFRINGTLAGTTPNCETTSGICEGDVLVASDCTQARVFQATTLQNVGGTGGNIKINHDTRGTVYPGNDPTSWGGASDPSNDFSSDDTEILTFKTYAYFVANNTSGQPALFRHDGISTHAAEEMVEGVENMQIQYGVDTDSDGVANYYTSADNLTFTTAADPIVAVRISLLLRSNDEIPKRPATSNTFTLASTNVMNATADARLRKVFTTTIKIRNKGL